MTKVNYIGTIMEQAKEIEEQSRLITDMSTVNDELRHQIEKVKELEKRLEFCRDEYGSLMIRSNVQFEGISNLTEDNRELTEKVKDLEEANSKLKEEIRKRKILESEYVEEISAYDFKVKRLEATIKQREDGFAVYHERDEALNKVELLETKISNLKKELSETIKKYEDDKAATLHETVAEYYKMDSRNRDICEALRIAREKVDKLEAKVSVLERYREIVRDTIKELV